MPLFKGNTGDITTQFDMKGVEKIGLLKMDFPSACGRSPSSTTA
ncbi:MAG: hypothetical protein U0599_04055 [Vicinamibacteria bacterium]